MVTRLSYCAENVEVTLLSSLKGRGNFENLINSGLEFNKKVCIKKNLCKGPVDIEYSNRIFTLGREIANNLLVETDDIKPICLSVGLIGDTFEISQVNAKGEIRRRLIDMGLVKGNKLEILRSAPLGDPIEIKISNFNLSLRISEAESIKVIPTEIKNQ